MHASIRFKIAYFQAFQYRKDGSVDFYKNWDDYEQGFGTASTEYWLGMTQGSINTPLSVFLYFLAHQFSNMLWELMSHRDSSFEYPQHMSRDMRFPTMWYVRPAKRQISLRIRVD